jgi:glycerol-3-phosphate acyltransferase PlsY
MIFCFIISAVVAYLVGSFNSAIIVSRSNHNEDIREHGSKNAGLTNMLRTYGSNDAFLTFLGDFIKGVIGLLSTVLIFKVGKCSDCISFALYFSMLFTILGHVFPVFFKFKGGKGVLTSAACLLVIDWRVFLSVIAVFAIVLYLSKYVSLSSVLATVSAVLFTVLYGILDGAVGLLPKTLLLSAVAFLIIIKHRTNISRLIKGTENKLSVKKKG